jgi:hypothetical protein
MVIQLNIDLAKIDKSKIKEFTRKNGSIGKGLNLVVFLKDEADSYGNHGFVSESVPKDSGEIGTILGNAKIAGQKATPQYAPQPAPQVVQATPVPNDLPF